MHVNFFQDKSSLNLTPEVPWGSLDHQHFWKTCLVGKNLNSQRNCDKNDGSVDGEDFAMQASWSR